MKFQKILFLTIIFVNFIHPNEVKQPIKSPESEKTNIHYYISRGLGLSIYAFLATQTHGTGKEIVNFTKEFHIPISIFNAIYTFNKSGELLKKITKLDDKNSNYKYYFAILKSLIGLGTLTVSGGLIYNSDEYNKWHQVAASLMLLSIAKYGYDKVKNLEFKNISDEEALNLMMPPEQKFIFNLYKK